MTDKQTGLFPSWLYETEDDLQQMQNLLMEW